MNVSIQILFFTSFKSHFFRSRRYKRANPAVENATEII
jgi:hypothetical protein